MVHFILGQNQLLDVLEHIWPLVLYHLWVISESGSGGFPLGYEVLPLFLLLGDSRREVDPVWVIKTFGLGKSLLDLYLSDRVCIAKDLLQVEILSAKL